MIGVPWRLTAILHVTLRLKAWYLGLTGSINDISGDQHITLKAGQAFLYYPHSTAYIHVQSYIASPFTTLHITSNTCERSDQTKTNKNEHKRHEDAIMVIGLLAIAAIPTVAGVAFGVSEQRKANTRMQDEKRMAKFYMQVYCEGDSEKARSLNGRRAVLRDNKVYFLVIYTRFFSVSC